MCIRDRFVTPLFDLIRPVPTIAWIPLMILWFGIGLGAKAAIILSLIHISRFSRSRQLI